MTDDSRADRRRTGSAEERPPGLLVVAAASFDEVMAALASARDLARGSGPWTRRLLESANTQFDGRWTDVLVSGAALLQVVLPRHAGEPCHGDRREMVAASGATVSEAARHLAAWDVSARAENVECWRRLELGRDEPFSRVVLSRAPLRAHPDYDGLPPGRALYHLDGFHRLVAWAMAGRIGPADWFEAHVAGP